MSEDKKIIFSMVGVTKSTPQGKQIIKNIHLSFFYGAKIGIIGLNGSGKSTVMKIIAGLDQAYQGDVVFSPGYSVGYLPQETELDLNKSVKEIVIQKQPPPPTPESKAAQQQRSRRPGSLLAKISYEARTKSAGVSPLRKRALMNPKLGRATHSRPSPGVLGTLVEEDSAVVEEKETPNPERRRGSGAAWIADKAGRLKELADQPSDHPMRW